MQSEHYPLPSALSAIMRPNMKEEEKNLIYKMSGPKVYFLKITVYSMATNITVMKN